MRHALRSARRGFTLVELLIAAALAILIMAILATAFGAALDTMSMLKSTGELAEHLRTTERLLDADLKAKHFATGTEGGNSEQTDRNLTKVSDLKFHLDLRAQNSAVKPPAGGFVMLYLGFAGNGASVYEGSDTDGVMSTASNQHSISMSVKRTSASPSDLFYADVSALNVPATVNIYNSFMNESTSDVSTAPGTYVGRWAEVSWFLDNRVPDLNGIPMGVLCRKVRLLTTNPITFPDGLGLENVISAHRVGLNWQSNTPDTIRRPDNRLIPPSTWAPVVAATDRDIMLTNVVSFELKPTWVSGQPITNYKSLLNPRPGLPALPPATAVAPVPSGSVGPAVNSDYPYDDLPAMNQVTADLTQQPENSDTRYADRRVFDTWYDSTNWNQPGTTDCIPCRGRVSGLQIKIRVYDVKNKQTRQMTIVQDL